jgi:hypothetical protein
MLTEWPIDRLLAGGAEPLTECECTWDYVAALRSVVCRRGDRRTGTASEGPIRHGILRSRMQKVHQNRKHEEHTDIGGKKVSMFPSKTGRSSCTWAQ